MKKYDFKETGFESYTNKHAKVVIVGITPGNNQLGEEEIGRLTPAEIKRKYAFRGEPMRSNLIDMLNFIGIIKFLGIESCKTIWEDDFCLVEMTSLLKKATYEIESGDMFNKANKIKGNRELEEEFNKGFVEDCKLYQDAKLFVACGNGVYKILMDLYRQNIINTPVIGIAHPSGQNGNWIKCYLKKKQANSETLKRCEKMRNDAIEQVDFLICAN